MGTQKHPVNSQIAFTYIIKDKKLSMVAALGVTMGVGVFIFMNSLMAGFDKQASEAFFKSIPHIRIYKDDEIAKPLQSDADKLPVLINPKIVPALNTIENPNEVLAFLKKQENITYATPQVSLGIFYNNAKSQISGRCIGILPEEANKQFNIRSFTVEGDIDQLNNNINGILIGSGIAEKMNVTSGDNISITSSVGLVKNARVVGIFKTNNSAVDKTTSYVNLAFAQQLLKKNSSYITDINVNIKDYKEAKTYASVLTQMINYKAEDWETANETYVAGNRMRAIIIRFVSFSILLVAGFGIYNILNMTVMQKINDIAILKAVGFNGKDVIRIFVSQALIIGSVGVVLGNIMATIMVGLMKNVYVGGDIGFFPIYFNLSKFILGSSFGLFVTFLAGYIPARKAANIDPVAIFRK